MELLAAFDDWVYVGLTRLGDGEFDEFQDMIGAQSLDPAQEMAEVETLFGGTDMSIVMDLFDHGDPGIAIEFPADATDITNDMDLFAGL